jgi:glutaredoxin
MKITIFTISDCYFSKQEKEYLQSHNLPFEERNLEENREFLTEMLTISNNFAGTPVTKIEKDDGQIVVLKGFTRDEFDKTFNFAPVPETQQAPTITITEPTPVVQATPSVAPEPINPPVTVQMNPVVPPPAVAAPSPVVAPASPTVDLGSIAAQIEQLKKLQESLAAQAPAPVVQAPAQPMPAYQPPAPQPVVPPVVNPPAPVAATPQAANVDDSLAAILAELQTKINSSQAAGTPGTPTTTN